MASSKTQARQICGALKTERCKQSGLALRLGGQRLGFNIEPGSTGGAACLPRDAADLNQPVNHGAGEVLGTQICRVLAAAHLEETKGAASKVVLDPQLTHSKVTDTSDAAPSADANRGTGVGVN